MSITRTKSRLIKSTKIFAMIATMILASDLLEKSAAQERQEEVDVDDIIPDDYDRLRRPGNVKLTDKLNVSVSLYVNDLLEVVDKDQTMHVDLILTQEWHENRINVSDLGPDFVLSDPQHIDRFWTPDIYFVNALSASVVDAFQTVRKLTIDRHGTMRYAQRINGKFSCVMNLRNFPHDFQYCHIKFSTLIYNRTDIELIWKNFAAQRSEYPIFKIKYWYTAECDEADNPIPGNSCLSGTMKLVRRLSYYIIRYYLITFLTMAITYVHMWTPINAWPARCTLLVMPILNLISSDIDMNNEIGVNYVTSLHWWYMWIQGQVYLELVEYAVATSWAHFICDKQHYAKQLALARQIAANGGPPVDPDYYPDYFEGYYFGNKGWYARIGAFFDKFCYFFFGDVDLHLDPYSRNKVDYVCRVVYVLVFIFFVFLYTMITVPYWAGNFNDGPDEKYNAEGSIRRIRN